MNSILKIFKQQKLARNFSICCSRLQSAETLSIPTPDGQTPPVSPKIQGLVEDISRLSLLEVSELSSVLKRTLNLPDAPVMSFGGFAPAAAAPAEEEEVVPVIVKTNYTVKLTKFDDTKKVALIKEIKSLLEDMNLVQAKKFVESAPTVVKADIGKDEAEKLKESLEKVGAVCVIE